MTGRLETREHDRFSPSATGPATFFDPSPPVGPGTGRQGPPDAKAGPPKAAPPGPASTNNPES